MDASPCSLLENKPAARADGRPGNQKESDVDPDFAGKKSVMGYAIDQTALVIMKTGSAE